MVPVLVPDSVVSGVWADLEDSAGSEGSVEGLGVVFWADLDPGSVQDLALGYWEVLDPGYIAEGD